MSNCFIPVLSVTLFEIEDKLRGDGVVPSLNEFRLLFKLFGSVFCVNCALGLCEDITVLAEV